MPYGMEHAVDLEWNPLRSPGFDLALAPTPDSGLTGLYGLGVQGRTSAWFAMQPGLHVQQPITIRGTPTVTGGLALIFGDQPSY
jgi:hypothetical protein